MYMPLFYSLLILDMVITPIYGFPPSEFPIVEVKDEDECEEDLEKYAKYSEWDILENDDADYWIKRIKEQSAKDRLQKQSHLFVWPFNSLWKPTDPDEAYDHPKSSQEVPWKE